LNLAELRQGKKALQLEQVGLPQVVRAHDPTGQLAVVGEQEQTGAGIFQPPDGKHARRNRFQKSRQRFALFGIAHGGHHFWRLVHRQVQRLSGVVRQQPAVHLDVVARGVGLGAQLGHHLSIQRHLPSRHHFFGVAARGQPRARNYFLDSFLHD
jgi:hypothetical protein